jgi:hypothetical protein
MRAISRTLTLLLLSSVPLLGAACSGDVGSIGGDGTEIGGDGATEPGDVTRPDIACDVDAALRCSADGGVEVCVEGLWEATAACEEGLVCDDGECVAACVASCEGKLCGDDGCGGVCGLCTDGEACDDAGQCGVASCEPACEGRLCGDDGCGGVCGMCADGETCADGACSACAPTCGAKVCGDDGCGGSCGDCADGETCFAGQCQPCAASCEGKVCGDDGCGGTCGACADGESCQDGQCGTCTPSCDGLACGDDGCGGSCGDCASGESCVGGACEIGTTGDCAGVTFEGCCNGAMLQYCDEGILQEMDCSESPQGSCGWDAEGGYYNCGTDGAAEPTGAYPYLCEGSGECEPMCDGLSCGSDGCGGVCGACEEGLQCIDGGCVDTGCPAGQMLDCNDECIAMGWLGDGICDAGLGCEAFDYDGGDCATPCPEGEVYDCEGACVDGALVGDGTCQEAMNCAATEWDGMDCEPSCADDQVVNCELGCTAASWVGDDYCDAKLNCEAFEFDGGDCEEGPCEPTCGDAVCGADGCGGECGTCGEGLNCVQGQCSDGPCEPTCGDAVCGADGCGGECGTCGEGLNCVQGQCSDGPCEPTCGDAVCGADGCGGECGTCGEGLSCVEGQCSEAPCEPTCGDAVCGADGCGGECGTCGEGLDCVGGQCNEPACEPTCGDSACGADGCGGVCGVCAVGTSCEAGACVEDVVVDPTDCATIASCVTDCEAEDEGCVDACVAAGSADAIVSFNAWDQCQAGCDTNQCVFDSCADQGSECFWSDTGEATCLEVNECLGGCDELECSEACLLDGSETSQSIWLQLLWCNNAVCGLAEPGDDYDACWAAALEVGGACADYATACIDDSEEEPIVPPTPEPTSSCGEVFSCAVDCDADDTTCVEACAAAGSDAAAASFGAIDGCVDECDGDLQCLLEDCAPAGAACFWPGSGEANCIDINDCLGTCEGDSECADACFASGSDTAKTIWIQISWCVSNVCVGLADDDLAACQDDALGAGGECESYVTACYFDEEVSDPEPAEGLSCGDVYGCQGECDADDTACLQDCIGAATAGAQTLYDSADACFTGCEQVDNPQACWSENCAGVGAECFYEAAGTDTCLDAINCLDDCGNSVDFQSCATTCLLSSSTEAQEQVLTLDWCIGGACVGVTDVDALGACQAEAVDTGGVCEAYVSSCLGSDG